ncbi:MAG: hypothetical protein AMJ69_08500 [Gammaproteobacteria bacterium SG8_47]|nr:MAG: hypothetical protein AMJ69_08500 [Gammaproteobacteria bacterium SG8_47]
MARKRNSARRKRPQAKPVVDQPRRVPGRWMLVVGIVTSLAAGLAWSGVQLIVPPTMPINTLRVEGEIAHVAEDTLRSVALAHVAGGFFETNVESVRRAIEAMPWVRSSAVRRVWPDSLLIQISEHEPLARWNGTAVLSRAGATFEPGADEIPNHLPRFEGPAGSERYLAERYDEFRRVLASIGLDIARVSMDERRAVELELDNGIVLLLGRDERRQRVLKLVDIYAAVLRQREDDIIAVDLRYTNGFAVQWRSRPETVGEAEAGNRV